MSIRFTIGLVSFRLSHASSLENLSVMARVFCMVISMMVTAFTIYCIQNGLHKTEGHAEAQDDDSVPHTPKKEVMASIPCPLKRKWKHKYSPFNFYLVS